MQGSRSYERGTLFIELSRIVGWVAGIVSEWFGLTKPSREFPYLYRDISAC